MGKSLVVPVLLGFHELNVCFPDRHRRITRLLLYHIFPTGIIVLIIYYIALFGIYRLLKTYLCSSLPFAIISDVVDAFDEEVLSHSASQQRHAHVARRGNEEKD